MQAMNVKVIYYLKLGKWKEVTKLELLIQNNGLNETIEQIQ
jgi:hypothetical protein